MFPHFDWGVGDGRITQTDGWRSGGSWHVATHARVVSGCGGRTGEALRAATGPHHAGRSTELSALPDRAEEARLVELQHRLPGLEVLLSHHAQALGDAV